MAADHLDVCTAGPLGLCIAMVSQSIQLQAAWQLGLVPRWHLCCKHAGSVHRLWAAGECWQGMPLKGKGVAADSERSRCECHRS